MDDDTFQTNSRARVEALVATRFGAPPARLEAVPAGLGTRRFFRVWLAAPALVPDADAPVQSIVARVEREEDPSLRPAGIPPEPALEPLRSVLEECGLPVPACYADEAGVALLEDVGDTSLEAAVLAGLSGDALAARYREACMLLPLLQRVAPRDDVPAFTRRLDEPLFRYKAEQLARWTLPWALGTQAAESAARAVREAFAWIAEECRRAPLRLSHRDYKAANLHLHARRPTEPDRLVMIDIQGAFLAPPEYDLVCLLRDSHVALPEPLVAELCEETRRALPDAPEPAVFDRRFTLLTLTRNGKDLSRYLYAAQVRNDERYLRLVPRAVATLKAAASHAAGWDSRLARLEQIVSMLPESTCAR